MLSAPHPEYFFLPASPSSILTPSFFCIFNREHKYSLISYFIWHYLHAIVRLLVQLFQRNNCYCCLFFESTDSSHNFFWQVITADMSQDISSPFPALCLLKSFKLSNLNLWTSHSRLPGRWFIACVMETLTGLFLAFSTKPGGSDKGITIRRKHKG